jgi:tetratricopeptide (TPR) repeat protein
MDGRPWLEAFVKPVKPERIFSWEGVGNDKAGLHTEHIRQDPAESALAIEQLVELGYITAPSEDLRKTVRDTLSCNKINLIRALLGTPQEAKAIPLLEELIAENEANEWALLTLANCQIRFGKYIEARAILEGITPATQQLGQIQLLFAQLAFGENKPDVALNHLQTAVSSELSHPLLFTQLGWAFLRLRRWEEAATAFHKSLDFEPENPAAFDGLARVHLEKNESELAVEKSLQAVGLVHYFPEAHYHLGTGLEQLGKFKEAILAYETALSMGYQPGLLHGKLAALYRPIDSQKTLAHAKAVKLGKRKFYRADIKSKLPSP